MCSLMSKKNLSEEDIKRLYITPALEAKWQLITMETQVTDGQYNLKGNFASRKQGKRADYLLYISENNPIAVVEAKDNRHSISHGLQQAMQYAQMLDLPFAYSSNGDGFTEHDFLTGTERTLKLDEFPTQDELIARYKKEANLTKEQEEIIQQPYYSSQTTNPPRYYQRIAVNRTLNAIAKGQNRILLVMATGTGKDTDLTFKAQPVWKQEDFQNTLSDIFDNRNYSSFNNIYKYNLAALNSTNYGYDLLSKIWEAMIDDCANGSLTIKSGYTLENALQQIFKDWYNIHYIVKSGNDAIDEMSPGKKALVLLELLINLEDSKCPILIDQPEDDLDNRSIYNDLVQYIKNKKKERQIIVVTHNANVVLGADAEEVIIANQDSKNSPNYSRRFEYRSGAIENDEKLTDENENVIPGILNQSGIQTQICDILEGGKSAFELRKNKYSSLTDLHE